MVIMKLDEAINEIHAVCDKDGTLTHDIYTTYNLDYYYASSVRRAHVVGFILVMLL